MIICRPTANPRGGDIYSAAGRVFCFRCYDEVRRSSRTVVRKPKLVYNILLYLARARTLHVAKETAVFFFLFFRSSGFVIAAV